MCIRSAPYEICAGMRIAKHQQLNEIIIIEDERDRVILINDILNIINIIHEIQIRMHKIFVMQNRIRKLIIYKLIETKWNDTWTI